MHLPQLGLGQPAERLADEQDMVREGLGEPRPPGVRQIEPIGPAILGVGTPLDPPTPTRSIRPTMPPW